MASTCRTPHTRSKSQAFLHNVHKCFDLLFTLQSHRHGALIQNICIFSGQWPQQHQYDSSQQQYDSNQQQQQQEYDPSQQQQQWDASQQQQQTDPWAQYQQQYGTVQAGQDPSQQQQQQPQWVYNQYTQQWELPQQQTEQQQQQQQYSQDGSYLGYIQPQHGMYFRRSSFLALFYQSQN